MSLRDQFRAYHKLTEDETKKLWDEGIFYLDTSMLFSLYRYRKDTQDKMLRALGRLKGRVWVPYHAGIEYHRNRLSVIRDQKTRFGEVRKAIDKGVKHITDVFRNKAIKQRHPTIEPDEFVANLKEVTSEFKKQLTELEADQPNFTDHDEIGEKIIELVGDNVTPNPGYSQEDIDALAEQGSERYEAKIGPGWDDWPDKEGRAFRHNGLIYREVFGDLIIWRQIMKHAKENGHKHVVFLLDDQKPDWWHIEGGKTIGPRIDLRQEIAQEADVELFHMYTPGSFASNADEFIGVKFEEDTIRQIDELSAYERAARSAAKMAIHQEAAMSRAMQQREVLLRAAKQEELVSKARKSAQYEVDALKMWESAVRARYDEPLRVFLSGLYPNYEIHGLGTSMIALVPEGESNPDSVIYVEHLLVDDESDSLEIAALYESLVETAESSGDKFCVIVELDTPDDDSLSLAEKLLDRLPMPLRPQYVRLIYVIRTEGERGEDSSFFAMADFGQ